MNLFKNIDFLVLLSALTLSLFGLSIIYSFGDNNFQFWKQISTLTISLTVFFIASKLDIYFLKNSKFILFLYLIVIIMFLALPFFGSSYSGANSWFSLGFFSFQPTDFAKIVLILLLSNYFFKRHVEISRIKHLLVSGVYTGIIFIFLALQPDLGSAMIISFIWLGFVVISGIPKKYIFSCIIGGLGLFYVAYHFIFALYQQERVLTFLNPERDLLGSGYNISQAHIALGNGGWFGQGISSGTQSRLEFLPEAKTDFIFSSFGEEWGFVGVLILFIIFSFIIYRIIFVAIMGRTNFESFLAAGIAIYFISHFFVHVGINLGIMPVTGMTMPFMSYGGSHLLAEFFALGLVNAISKTNRSFNRKELLDTDIIS